MSTGTMKDPEAYKRRDQPILKALRKLTWGAETWHVVEEGNQ